MQQSSKDVCQLCGKRVSRLKRAHIVDKTAHGIAAKSICSSVALPVIAPFDNSFVQMIEASRFIDSLYSR
jgi:hypothetical protein